MHRRQGHSAPVSHVRFYDDTNLVSAGQDSGMFLFSVDHDRHNKSMGKAVWNKKAEVKRVMPSFSQVYAFLYQVINTAFFLTLYTSHSVNLNIKSFCMTAK